MDLINPPYTTSTLTECVFREALLTAFAAIEERRISDHLFGGHYNELREALLHAIARARAHVESCTKQPKGLTKALSAAVKKFELTGWEVKKVGEYTIGLTGDSSTIEHLAQCSPNDRVGRIDGTIPAFLADDALTCHPESGANAGNATRHEDSERKSTPESSHATTKIPSMVTFRKTIADCDVNEDPGRVSSRSTDASALKTAGSGGMLIDLAVFSGLKVSTVLLPSIQVVQSANEAPRGVAKDDGSSVMPVGRIILSRDHADHVLDRAKHNTADADRILHVLHAEMQSVEEELRRLNAVIIHRKEFHQTIAGELRRRNEGWCA